MMFHEQIEHIRKLFEASDWDAVRGAISSLPAPEIATLLFELDDLRERVVVFRLLPHDLSVEVFGLLEGYQQNVLLEEFTQEEARRLLNELTPDDRTYLFEELPGQVTQKLLNLLSPEDARDARRFLGYPRESVGRLMTPDYIAVRPDWTIGQALDHVRARGQDSETIDVLYVVDKDWKLLDALDLRRFILTDRSARVSNIMDGQYIALNATQDREDAVRTMERYDVSALPVVDSTGVLVGIVTFDDVMDVARAEVTEDFHKSAAVAPLTTSYRDATFLQVYRKRIGWLVLLVFVNIFSGAAIANFEETLAANLALVFFLPLLIDSSGNAGSQAATLMVRALAVGDVRTSDWGRLLIKEIGIALTLGLTMSVAVSAVGFLRAGAQIALVVSLTMIVVVVFGSFIGTALPFILSRFRLDPATASAPLITSLADISGVIIYLSIATALLGTV
jgi:magnesium transporter